MQSLRKYFEISLQQSQRGIAKILLLSLLLTFPTTSFTLGLAHAGGPGDLLKLLEGPVGKYVINESQMGRGVISKLFGSKVDVSVMSYDVARIAAEFKRAGLEDVMISRLRALNYELAQAEALRGAAGGSLSAEARLALRKIEAGLEQFKANVSAGSREATLLDDLLQSKGEGWKKGSLSDVGEWIDANRSIVSRTIQSGRRELQYLTAEGATYTLTTGGVIRRVMGIPRHKEILATADLERYLLAHGKTADKIFGGRNSDLIEAHALGEVSEGTLVQFAKRSGRGVVGMLMKYNKNYRNRILTDPKFVADFATTMLMGTLAMLTADYVNHGDWEAYELKKETLRNSPEWSEMNQFERHAAILKALYESTDSAAEGMMEDKEFVLKDVTISVCVNYVLVTYFANRRSATFDPGKTKRMADMTKLENGEHVRLRSRMNLWMDKLPDNIFSPGDYTLRARTASFFVKGLTFGFLGAGAAVAGDALSAVLANQLDEDEKENTVAEEFNDDENLSDQKKTRTTLETADGWGTYLGIVSNTRYQGLSLATNLIERSLGRSPIMSMGLRRGLRAANEFWGPLLMMDWMEFRGYDNGTSKFLEQEDRSLFMDLLKDPFTQLPPFTWISPYINKEKVSNIPEPSLDEAVDFIMKQPKSADQTPSGDGANSNNSDSRGKALDKIDEILGIGGNSTGGGTGGGADRK